MSTAKTRAFLFDVDGTLLDSNRLHAAAWHRAFAGEGRAVPIEEILLHIGKGSDKLVASLRPGIDESRARRLRSRTQREFTDVLQARGVSRFRGVRELLLDLRARGLLAAIATSAQRGDFERLVRAGGLPIDLIDRVVTGEDVKHTKPDPDIVERAVAAVGVSAPECVMVGDTPYDAEASVRAGVPFVGVRTGAHDERALRDAGAIHVVPDIASLAEQLDYVLSIV